MQWVVRCSYGSACWDEGARARFRLHGAALVMGFRELGAGVHAPAGGLARVSLETVHVSVCRDTPCKRGTGGQVQRVGSCSVVPTGAVVEPARGAGSPGT